MSNRNVREQPSSHILISLGFDSAPDTLRHNPKPRGCSIHVRSSTSLLPLGKGEESAVDRVVGVSEVGRRLRPRWTPFFAADGFSNPKHGIEPGGGRTVRGDAARE